MDSYDQLRFAIKFNRKEGDVRCCAHIYNIAVQAGISPELFLVLFYILITVSSEINQSLSKRASSRVPLCE